MSEFDHGMQGQSIAALQSMRHHQEASSEGPGSGLGLDSSFLWFLKSGLYDYSAVMTGNIDNVIQSLFNSMFPERWLLIFDQGNPNITLLGFPVLMKSFEQTVDDGLGMEDTVGQVHELNGYGSNNVRGFTNDYPNANYSIMDSLGEDADGFSYMQYSPTQDYDHSPIISQQEEGIGHGVF